MKMNSQNHQNPENRSQKPSHLALQAHLSPLASKPVRPFFHRGLTDWLTPRQNRATAFRDPGNEGCPLVRPSNGAQMYNVRLWINKLSQCTTACSNGRSTSLFWQKG